MIRDQTSVGKKIAIILPAYNEELTIRETICAFHFSIPEAALYVVNNRSSDNTEAIARATLFDLGCKGAVINEWRRGKGNAIRRAFHDIEADIYVLADADLTYPADRVRDLIQPIIEGWADMVVGDRHSAGHYAVENKRHLHNFGNKLVQWLVNILFDSALIDIMSGYRTFSRSFVKSYPILVEGFEIETDMTLHALDKRFQIVEIPIEYKDRPAESVSKLNTYRDGARVIFTIAQILRHYRPLRFFGGLSGLLAVTSLIVAIPVFQDWLLERYIHHVPLAILASGIAILSSMMLSIGLILDSIADQNRRNFELDLLALRSQNVSDRNIEDA